MELRGQLKSWNDKKGFGFIRPEQGGEDIFAHISAMRGPRRPMQGDRVLYLRERDKGGRLHATHIRLDAPLSLDEPATRGKPATPTYQSARPTKPELRNRHKGATRQPVFRLVGLILLCVLPTLGTLRLAEQDNYWPVLAYLVGSLVAFGLYLHDKRSALRSGWRTPEARLHLIELFGGWPGALLAQQLLRHKTRKFSFQLVFWLIVMAHQVMWLDYLYLQRLEVLIQLPV